MSCGAYRGVKLLEHAMKIVKRVLQKKIRFLVNMNRMQFGFMPGRETIDALFILGRMQEEYQDKGKKLFRCFVDLENTFNRVLRKVTERAMRKKEVPGESSDESVQWSKDERQGGIRFIWCTSRISVVTTAVCDCG